MKLMYSLILLIVFVCPLFPFTAQAHELLPKAVVEYIDQHPDASVEDIQAFIAQNAPSLVGRVKNAQDVVALVNRKTNFFDNSRDFLVLGMKHILSGPDHILFVLSLLLVFVYFKEILKLTGSFTLAHSITLLLAGTGMLTLPSRFVEPMIALSIAYVALTSVFIHYSNEKKRVGNKIATVFFFGLFHGLGFAGLLKEIRIPSERFISSLVSFNIGIEMGQLIIVLAALPFIFYFRNYPWYPKAIKAFGIVIGCIGIFWAIQRVFV